jgi:FKBP-type peptidyl-prolyl cis-trans isomerase
MKKYYVIVFALLIFFSCKKGKEYKTESGFKYILYNESKGPKAKVGDYLTIIMTYRNSVDSVLYDSRTNGNPLRFRLEKIPFHGSFEEGLTYMAIQDSATFFVPADSLYNYLYKSRGAEKIPQDKTAFIPGSLLKFDIKLLNIQTDAQAEEEIIMQMSELEKKERVDLAHYIDKNKINIQPDSSGYYLIIKSKGSGEPIDSGKMVIVEYEGRFLDNKVFDGTKKAGQPYRFISGAEHVIKGWELGMKNLKVGDKFTLLLPSKLAYGEEGLQDPNTGSFIVPPYTPLVFDIEIISVEDVPSASGR